MSILRPLRPSSFMAVRNTSISNTSRRAFHASSRSLIKEDADRSPQEIENKKQEQLKEQKEGRGQWKEELASSGESNIAADKQEVKDHDKHMDELQKETAKKGEKGDI